jgi:DNA-binding CsgD family transcriptional regulator
MDGAAERNSCASPADVHRAIRIPHLDDATVAFGLILALAEQDQNQPRGKPVHDVVIAQIYEAAVAPKLWPDAIRSLGDYAGSDRGTLAVLPPVGKARWIASPDLKCRLSSTITLSSCERPGRDPQWHTQAHTQFIHGVGADFFCCDSTFCRGDKPSWQIGTAISLPTGDLAILTAERQAEKGPFEPCSLSRLDALRPHLVRACHLSAQFGYERARVTTAALDRIGLPAAVLTASGRILAMNGRLEERGESIMSGQHGGLTFKSLINSRILQEAVGKIVNGQSVAQAIPLRDQYNKRTFIGHVLRLEDFSNDIFDASAILLVLIQVGAPAALDDRLLSLLFNLTPAEARLLRALADGLRLQIYAQSAGVKISTVRSQLKSIFSKTGTNRQAELLSFVASMSAFNGHSPHC